MQHLIKSLRKRVAKAAGFAGAAALAVGLASSANADLTEIGAYGNTADADGVAEITASDPALGNYSLRANGTDFWGGSDHGMFAYDPVPVSGDFSAVVRSVSIGGLPGEEIAGEWGRTGIMARTDGSVDNSPNMAVIRKSGGSGYGVVLQGRDTFGGGTDRPGGEMPNSEIPNEPVQSTPLWLSLHREGNNYFSSWAPDVNGTPGDWAMPARRLGSTDLRGDVFLGLVHQSHNIHPIANTAVFESFTVGTLDMSNLPEIPPPPPITGSPGTILGVGTDFLLQNDLTDPDGNGLPDEDTNYNAEFRASIEEGFGGGEFAFNVFDNLVGGGNDKWCCDAPSVSGPEGLYVDAHLIGKAPQQLTSFTVTSGNDTPGRDPRDWKIQGSLDGESWTTIYERTGDETVWDTRNQVVLFEGGTDYPMPDEGYTWFRFNTTRTGLTSGAAFQINELEYFGVDIVTDFFISGNGETYFEDFDGMGTSTGITPTGWKGDDGDGPSRSINGLGLTDGFLTVPGNDADGVLGVLNLGGNADSFGPSPDGQIETWSAELGGDNDLYGRDDVIADNASDRALGVSRENNDHTGKLNFEIEIDTANMRAFVFDWDLEIWGGDPDATYRSAEGPGMKVDLKVGGTTYYEEAKNLLPGDKFDSTEDGSNDHNPTLIDGNVHSVRGMTSGIQEISGDDGAVGNLVQVNFDSNWNGANDDGANGWISAVDNVRLRALAPGDADANGVVDVTDLLALLGGQKFNQGVDGVTWEQGDFNADDQFDTSDLLAMLSFLSGTFPSDPYASEAGGASDAVADVIVNSETGEVTVDLAGHTVSAVIIESASEIFNGSQPEWDTTSQFPSTLPGELGNVLFTSTASGTDELGAVISAEFLGRDKDFYLQDLDLNILIASEGGALTKGNVIVVPEPSTWMLLGLGSLAIVGVIRRRMA